MKRQIRRKTFETNSSSTHSICIVADAERENLPESVEFTFGEFGWEECIYYETEAKASYLYTALVSLSDPTTDELEEYKSFIENTLDNVGVSCEFAHAAVDTWEHDGKIYTHYSVPGYIDHVYGTRDFINDVLSDESKLLNFLFSRDSFIITGNDNSGTDVSINVGYEHFGYYKGN